MLLARGRPLCISTPACTCSKPNKIHELISKRPFEDLDNGKAHLGLHERGGVRFLPSDSKMQLPNKRLGACRWCEATEANLVTASIIVCGRSVAQTSRLQTRQCSADDGCTRNNSFQLDDDKEESSRDNLPSTTELIGATSMSRFRYRPNTGFRLHWN